MFQSIVHGVAFAVSGEAAIPYLSKRECKLGGYDTNFATFYLMNGESIKVLLYIATPKNSLWLGDAPLPHIATQIADCSGPSGHNVEYIIRLANFMRHHFPDEEDAHLFSLEKEVLSQVEFKNMCLATLMGDGKGCITFRKFSSPSSSPPRQREGRMERMDTFQYTARVPEKTLRCLNI